MHRDNREKLLQGLRRRSEVPASAVVYLEGGDEISVYDTDTVWDFKQESNFQYLFGAKEPGCRAALRVSDGRSVLFVPNYPPSYAAWMGPIKPLAWFQRAYEVDEARFVELKGGGEGGSEEVAGVVSSELEASCLLVLDGTNRDSGLQPKRPSLEGFEVPVSPDGSCALWEELAEARVVKSPDEVKLLQFANDVSSHAHVELMRGRVGLGGSREYLAEAAFRYQAALRGCFRVGYTCICPTGSRNAFLHYGHAAEPNSEPIEQGSLTLRDMGAEYHCYTADVTCTYPVSGRFTEPQRQVYEAVWAATLAVEQTIRPGVCYKDMHRLAQRTLLVEMEKVGLLVGDVEEMVQAEVAGVFMFHGLGHGLGLDVHDVGGYEPGLSRDPAIKQNLRLGRKLKEGMVITVEPGFYFSELLLEEALEDPQRAKFINRARLEELRPVGGVRIEDDVVITATGCRVLTNVPRTVAEIEAVMDGQPWNVGQCTCREYVNC